MKNFRTLIFLFSFPFIFSACEETETPKLSSEDYLIFGKFAGFCLGENCVRIFKLDSNQDFSLEDLGFQNTGSQG
ncbi:MAG: hypothetical protein RLO81_15065 [Fulvivirga sp.]|uniref:hypothetical protein n=1 Tax=Fulvivirga sp. TaxID=1931237 RepID=UPI0032ED09E3